MSNQECVKDLEPKMVWDIFSRLADAPRPSKKEEKVKAVIKKIADDAGFELKEDRVGNYVVSVPGTSGFENAPTIVIQGHIDMVCEKNNDTVHDFDNDPIKLRIGESAKGRAYVDAEGTTLGADNGIGVAMGLAAALDPKVAHGPLELLMTIDEEAGMTGAQNVNPGFITGKCMLNLDSEEDDALYVGCAGGCDVTLDWDFPTSSITGESVCKLTVKGLRGGHSGINIHENRGNAGKLLARTILEAGIEGLRLVDGKCGSLRNAIPREAWAILAGPSDMIARLGEAAKKIQTLAIEAHNELQCQVTVAEAEGNEAISAKDTNTVVSTFLALPSGVQAVVPEIAGEVLSSNNAATLDVKKADANCHVSICCLARSSDRDSLYNTVHQIRSVGVLAGAKLFHGNEYPGWKPDMQSHALEICKKLYSSVFGVEPRIAAMHAGLECGVINTSVGGGMDMISFGPTIHGAHSPGERVYIDSVEKIWRYFVVVLGELAKG